jgi:hypothetical protein
VVEPERRRGGGGTKRGGTHPRQLETKKKYRTPCAATRGAFDPPLGALVSGEFSVLTFRANSRVLADGAKISEILNSNQKAQKLQKVESRKHGRGCRREEGCTEPVKWSLGLEEVVVGARIALRIGALPPPRVLHHLCQVEVRTPTQLLLGLDWVGVAGGDVTCVCVCVCVCKRRT